MVGSQNRYFVNFPSIWEAFDAYFGVFVLTSGFRYFCDPSHAKPLFLRVGGGSSFSLFLCVFLEADSRHRFLMRFVDFGGRWRVILEARCH